jgi:hypothetical protein
LCLEWLSREPIAPTSNALDFSAPDPRQVVELGVVCERQDRHVAVGGERGHGVVGHRAQQRAPATPKPVAYSSRGSQTKTS